MIDDVVECGNVENGSSRREVEEYSWRARMMAEMRENVVEVVERGEWSGYSGRFVNEVERSIETITGKRALLTNSGTSALECALAAAGVAEGMEVIIPCVAPHAALQGALRVGATPVLCRVDETTLTIDAADLDRRRTGRTAAVIFVYAFGNPTGIAEVARWCHRNRLTLIEDAASAFGASIGGRGVGSWGGAAILSFNHTKQLNCGEGGAVITGDPKTYDAARALRHGGLRRGALEYHEAVAIGGKFLMSELQAAALLPQIRNAGNLLAAAAERAARLRRELSDLTDVHLQRIADDARHAWWRVAATASPGRDIQSTALRRWHPIRVLHRPIVEEPIFAARAVAAREVADQSRDLWSRIGICDPMRYSGARFLAPE